jgi:hypothetical protein
MENLKSYITIGLVCLLVGAGITRYAIPAKIEVRTQEVIKEVEVTKKNVITVTEKITQKDGTVIEKTRTEDTSVESVAKDTKIKSETVTTNDKQWRVGVRAGKKINLNPEIIYGVSVEKKFIGSINLGGYVTTDKEVGLSVSLDF